MHKKLRTTLVMALALALLLTAFAGSGGAMAEKSPEEFSGDLVIWSWSESEIEIYAENFAKVYPNVSIKYVPVDNGDVTFKLQATAASRGEFPDVAFQEVTSRGKLFAMDIWEDLSAAPYNFDRSIVFTQLLNYMEDQDGRVLGIDREFNPAGFVFNRSLASQYLGTDDPKEVYAMISDWDKFVETGKQVAEKSGGKVYMLPGLDEINWMLSGQYSETIFDGDTAYLTDFFTHMFTPMIMIRDAGIAGAIKRWTPAWNASYNENTSLFYQYAPWSGTAALKANAPDTVGNWTVIKATGGACTLGGTAFGIPKEAKNKELAWEFIRWMLLTQEGTQSCVDSLGVVAVLKSFYEDMPDGSDPFFNGQDVNRFLLEEVAPDMKLRKVHEYDSIVGEAMGLMMDRIVDDTSIDLDKAIELAIAEVKNQLPATMTIK